jgi:hypothetical protein
VSAFNIYNCTVNVAEVKNVSIDAKYSKINIAKADNVSLNSYNDNITFGILNDINASANYSTIRIEGDAGKAKFKFHQSKLYGNNFQTMDISDYNSTVKIKDFGETGIFNMQYSSLTVGSGGDVKLKFHQCQFSGDNFQTIDVSDYNSTIKMKDLGASGVFNMQYSSLTVGNGGDVKFNTYQCNVKTAEVKNVGIDAKYSKFNIAKANNVSIKSYNDGFTFGMLNDISASAQYSTIRIESDAEKARIGFHNSKFYGKNFQSAKIGSSYQSEFHFATVDTFSCRTSKYDRFDFEQIVVEASLPDAFQTNVKINSTDASFKSFSGNFKYGNVTLKLHPSIIYNLNCNWTYGSINVSPDKFKTRFISDKNNNQTTVKGTNADAQCNIELVTYSTTCKIE